MKTITGAVAALVAFPAVAAADVPADRYTIISVLTGQCLAIGADKVELADCGGNATTWDVVPAGADEPALLIRHVLDCVAHDGTLGECGDPSQFWTVEQTEAGDFTILSAPERLALSVVPVGDNAAVHTVQTVQSTTEQADLWQLEPLE
ncbi:MULTISPECIES: RICIN domain-containing protein [Actinokineospora]|uniref:Ricin B lectin domain-containing protein n=1 Tax=Actinokineospora fastidiosa TaxID=1816 RepID=A0A918G809_9PSEU|nr:MULTISPECIES: hypothetical protein [Actinokineospora]UVS82533.1 hypothetical protein Actkin_06306 [Actinokineospora sp. UTMC 2448]GGS20405.1 hypothetical protein GCM10010171_11330 [Actinokineospora fastidiosa]